MKKILCMLALFLCFLIGCAKTSENTMEYIIFTDGEAKTKEVAREIQRKVQAVVVDFEKLEESDVEKLLAGAKMIFIGMEGGKTASRLQMDRLFALEGMKEKRASLFYVGNEEELILWEGKDAKKTSIRFTPGFSLSWKEEMREDELSRMDGWLTTAFTY